jgi:hypothetical protein
LKLINKMFQHGDIRSSPESDINNDDAFLVLKKSVAIMKVPDGFLTRFIR